MKMQAFLVLALGALIAADKPKADDTPKELKKFDGTWVLESLERGGAKVPASKIKGFELTIKAGECTLDTPDGETLDATIKVDATTEPASYEASLTDAEGDTKTSYGIYKMEGDTLTLCYSVEGKDKRPKKFETAKGSKTNLAVYKRKKMAKKPDPDKEN